MGKSARKFVKFQVFLSVFLEHLFITSPLEHSFCQSQKKKLSGLLKVAKSSFFILTLETPTRRIVWVCLTYLWGWRLKGKSFSAYVNQSAVANRFFYIYSRNLSCEKIAFYVALRKQLEQYLWDSTFNIKLSVESRHEKAEH